MKNKRLLFIMAGTTVLLLIPLIAMQFTEEVNWDAFDFLVMGILLFSTGLLCELILRMVKKPIYRVGICLFILLGFLLLWVEMAVGIFGSPIAGT